MKTKKQFTSVFLAILLSFAAFCALFCRINNTTETASAHTDATSVRTLCYLSDDPETVFTEQDLRDMGVNFTLRVIKDPETYFERLLFTGMAGESLKYLLYEDNGYYDIIAESESDEFIIPEVKNTVVVFDLAHYTGSAIDSAIYLLQEQGAKVMYLDNYSRYGENADVKRQNFYYQLYIASFIDGVNLRTGLEEQAAIMLDRRFIEADSFNSFYGAYQASWFLRGLAEYLREYLRTEREYGDYADELSPIEVFRQFEFLSLYVYMGDDNIQELLVDGNYGQLLKNQKLNEFCLKAGYLYFVGYGPLLPDAFVFLDYPMANFREEILWIYLMQIDEMEFGEDGLVVSIYNPRKIGSGEGQGSAEYEAEKGDLIELLWMLLNS